MGGAGAPPSIPNWDEYERTDLASLGPRFARRRPNLKNTESFRVWSFRTRNDRKKILRILRGDIDFSKKNVDFLDLGIFALTTSHDF